MKLQIVFVMPTGISIYITVMFLNTSLIMFAHILYFFFHSTFLTFFLPLLPGSIVARLTEQRRSAQSKPQIYNLPVAMRIIIEYQKLLFIISFGAFATNAAFLQRRAQYKSPGHYANLSNDTVPTSNSWGINERYGSSS